MNLSSRTILDPGGRTSAASWFIMFAVGETIWKENSE